MTERFQDRFENETYNDGAPCFIGLGETELHNEKALEIPTGILSRIIHLGHAYSLHLTSMFDVYGETSFNKEQCESLLEELSFIERVTNDKLLHKYLRGISKLILNCVGRDNCRLFISGN